MKVKAGAKKVSWDHEETSIKMKDKHAFIMVKQISSIIGYFDHPHRWDEPLPKLNVETAEVTHTKRI